MKLKLGLSNGITVGRFGSSGGAGDTTGPACAITSASSGVVAGAFSVTITFTNPETGNPEAVTGFALGDITCSANAGAGNLANPSTGVYTATITPTSSGAVTVDINAGVCTDAAGNNNTAATQFSISAIVYTLKDVFTTDDAAPITTPRTCEPGPGTLTITDTNNTLSIASSQLSAAIGANGTYDWRVIGSAIARATGLALGIDYKPTGGTPVSNVGFCNNAAGNNEGYFIGLAWRSNSANLQMPYSLSSVGLSGLTTNNNVRLVVALTATRSYLIAKTLSYAGGLNFTEYSILFVPRHGAPANVYPILVERSNIEITTMDNLAVAQLPAPFTSEFGLATGYSASPSSGATLTHTADGLAEITWTAATSATLELNIRQTDADNRWIIRCTQADSTIKIIERNAGVETERGSAAQTWTNGTAYSIQVQFYGNNIYTFVASGGLWEYYVKASYTSASFQNTATGASLTATAGALANFATYPRVLSGTALTVLQGF